MEFKKKMTRSGGITLPAALRREHGLEDGEKFDITAEADGSIRLRREQPKCVLCGSQDDLMVYNGKHVSKLLIERLYQQILKEMRNTQ